MSLEQLQADWEELLGEDGLQLAAGNLEADQEDNFLNEYARAKGLRGQCRYLLSSKFEHCGLMDSARFNYSPVLFDAMQRSVSAAIGANAPEGDSRVLVALSPYSAFGAEVMRVKHGYLILVSPVTFSLCFLYAILAVTSMQATGLMLQGLVPRSNDGEPLIDPFEWTYGSHRALRSAVREFSRTGTVAAPLAGVNGARFDLLPWHYIERIQLTYEQMLDFLVLHELGHVVLGHMKSAGTTRRSIPSTSVAYEVAVPAPRQEEEADDFALRCLVGTDTSLELDEITRLLDKGDFQNLSLDRLWLGQTCIGRYTSAIQLLKLFDLFDYYSTMQDGGTQYTDVCEIDGTHPSGQHRFMRAALPGGESLLSFPTGRKFSLVNIVSWNNWVTLDAANHTQEEILQWLNKVGSKHMTAPTSGIAG